MIDFTGGRELQDNMLHYYCFAHERPRFALDPRITIVELGERGAAQIDDRNPMVHAYDLVPDLAESHVWLGGSLGNFAVLQHLKRAGAAATDRVCISHYRRFLSPGMHGVSLPGEPGICNVSPEECQALDPYRLCLDYPGAYLTSQPWTDGFGEGMSVRDQYARAHYVDDLDRYMQLAQNLGIIESAAANSFLNGQAFIPGGIEFSMCPVATYTRVVGKIEALNRTYLARYEMHHRSAYQDRFLCYCNERLGSLLLAEVLKEASTGDVPTSGYMHIVSQSKRVQPGGWAPETRNQSAHLAATKTTCILHVGIAGAGGNTIRSGLRDYADDGTVFAGYALPKGYPSNNELIACALEQHEIDACLDYADRGGKSALEAQYHRCAWALQNLRGEIGKHPNRDEISARLTDWVAQTDPARVVFSTDSLDCIPFAIPRLIDWLSARFAQVQVIAYWPPLLSLLTAGLEHRLCAQSLAQLRFNWSRPLRSILKEATEELVQFQRHLGEDSVIVVAAPLDDPTGRKLVNDFLQRVGLKEASLAAVMPQRAITAEALAILAAYAEQVASLAPEEAPLASLMALQTLLSDFGERVFVPNSELLRQALADVPNDVEFPLHVAPLTQGDVSVATKSDILDFAEVQIDALRAHMANRWAYKLPRHIKTRQALGSHLHAFLKSNIQSRIKPKVPTGFDAARYLALNADVRQAGLMAERHFLKLGYFEGRRF